MPFNSYNFLLLFLPLVYVSYWYGFRRHRFRQANLLIASLVFYSVAGIGYLGLLLGMAGITFVAGRYFLSNPQWKKIGLTIGLSNLGVLAFFKYASLFDGLPSVLRVALPLGISFYTFNLLSYIFDVYRGRIEAERSVWKYITYISFFPTVTSGPLLRYSLFTQQYENSTVQRKPSMDDIELGLFGICIGLAKKIIIADQLAQQINPLFSNYESLGLIGAWVAVLGFTYQLYFDFSGYTDIAIGVGHLLGFSLPQNFNAPYSARNITDFWQRWHITLSTWFREYLFFPLSRSLLKRFPHIHSDLIRATSLLITMLLIGWWHGASSTFILWGIYHGALLAIHAQIRMRHFHGLPRWIARGITFGVVVLGWVLFRSTSLHMILTLIKALAGLHSLNDLAYLSSLGVGKRFFLVLIGLMVITNMPRDTGTLKPHKSWVYATGMAVLLVLSLMLLGEPQAFLYFKF